MKLKIEIFIGFVPSNSRDTRLLLIFKIFLQVDGTVLSFSNWSPGEPNGHNVDFLEDVVEMYPHTTVEGWRTVQAGQWNDLSGGGRHPFLCSHQTESSESGTGNGDCPVGWFQNRHFCYKLFTDPKPYQESLEDCQAQPAAVGMKGKNGNLVSIIDEFEFALGLVVKQYDSYCMSHREGAMN